MSDDRGTRDEGLTGRYERDTSGTGADRGPGPPAPGGDGEVGTVRRGPAGRRPTAGPVSGGGGDTGRSGGSRKRSRGKGGKGRAWWVELPILFAFALVLALLIKTFAVQAFFIPSSSMENTLKIGDKVLVNKLVYDFRPIHRGDIVVFNGDGSWNPVPLKSQPVLTRVWHAITGLFGTAPGVHDYIKRVIGIPGDHVVCCNTAGKITVNGVPLNETYLYPGNLPSRQKFTITVPPGRLWVMGDHRRVSLDSRGHLSDPGHGTIPESRVVGRAFMIIAPFSRWNILPIPATFEQPKLNAAGAALAPALGVAGLPGPASMTTAGGPGPLPPVTPLALGLTGVFPLTLLERRLRWRQRGPLSRLRARRAPAVRPRRWRHGRWRHGRWRRGPR